MTHFDALGKVERINCVDGAVVNAGLEYGQGFDRFGQ